MEKQRSNYKLIELRAKKILLDLAQKKELKDFEKSKINDNFANDNNGVQNNEMV